MQRNFGKTHESHLFFFFNLCRIYNFVLVRLAVDTFGT